MKTTSQIPGAVKAHMEEICGRLNARPRLRQLFRSCYPNSLETTLEIVEDGTVFLLTGDIPAMWLRDSTAQVTHYVPLAKEDAEVAGLIEMPARAPAA